MFVVYELVPRYGDESELTIWGVYEDEDEAEKEAERLDCDWWAAAYYPKQD